MDGNRGPDLNELMIINPGPLPDDPVRERGRPIAVCRIARVDRVTTSSPRARAAAGDGTIDAIFLADDGTVYLRTD